MAGMTAPGARRSGKPGKAPGVRPSGGGRVEPKGFQRRGGPSIGTAPGFSGGSGMAPGSGGSRTVPGRPAGGGRVEPKGLFNRPGGPKPGTPGTGSYPDLGFKSNR